MGTFKTRIGVNNGNGGATQWVEAFADTGANFTILPESFLRNQVGIRPKRYEVFSFADGSQRELPVGEARFEAEGRDAVSPVVFGAAGIYVLGAVSLQSMSLIADTTNHKLIPAPIHRA